MLFRISSNLFTGAVVAVSVWQLELQLHMQSVPITVSIRARCTTLYDKVCQ